MGCENCEEKGKVAGWWCTFFETIPVSCNKCYRATEQTHLNCSTEFTGSATKPPLGLRPKHIADWRRRTEIVEAMERYGKVNKPIPEQWFGELKELLAVA